MKAKIFAIFSITALLTGFAPADGEMLEIGQKAPLVTYPMEDVMTGKTLALKDIKRENGLLVIFSCNTCPFVLGWENEYPGLGEITKKNKIGMVLVNSNEAKRSDDDSADEMRKRYKDAGYNTPYVIDKDHKLADAFGGKTTPHVFLFNKNLELVYRGSINNKYEERGSEADKFYLNDALNALVKDQKIEPATTRQIGCSIKRVKA